MVKRHCAAAGHAESSWWHNCWKPAQQCSRQPSTIRELLLLNVFTMQGGRPAAHLLADDLPDLTAALRRRQLVLQIRLLLRAEQAAGGVLRPTHQPNVSKALVKAVQAWLCRFPDMPGRVHCIAARVRDTWQHPTAPHSNAQQRVGQHWRMQEPIAECTAKCTGVGSSVGLSRCFC